MHIGPSMLLACGPDRPLLEQVGKAVTQDFQIVEDFSFEQALEHQAVTLLCVEPIPRAGEPPPEPGSLASLLSAAEAPSVSRVLIVTSRADSDGSLRRVRQSGARYVIIRPPLVVDASTLRGKRVLIPRDAAEQPLVTIEDLVAVVRDAVADETMMGQTIDVPPSGIAALEAAGARPRVVAPWRAKLGRWFGQQVLTISDQTRTLRATA